MRPMLACKCKDVNQIQFPVVASPKIDGLRCLVIDGQVITRSGKPHPNRYVREVLSQIPHNLDGELIVTSKAFHETSGLLRRHDGQPDFAYLVFDCIDWPNKTFFNRQIDLAYCDVREFPVRILEQMMIETVDQLEKYEHACLAAGHEGIIFRSPKMPYKQGRSTWNEQGMVKLKRFEDAEARILSMVELNTNTNESFLNDLNYHTRSKCMEGLVPAGVMGALVVQDIKTGVQFEIGTGFTHTVRQDMWRNQNKYLNQVCTYKYQPYGTVARPRCPVFKSIRWDLSEQGDL